MRVCLYVFTSNSATGQTATDLTCLALATSYHWGKAPSSGKAPIPLNPRVCLCVCVFTSNSATCVCLCFQVFELSEQDIANQLFEKDASLRQCQVCMFGWNWCGRLFCVYFMLWSSLKSEWLKVSVTFSGVGSGFICNMSPDLLSQEIVGLWGNQWVRDSALLLHSL